ncbi:hypothetical protein MsAg5_02650 [Methanosarcinaceae archaeon Ag5]|uniref:Right handed beta helix domain-containing protein n=1 Tax=Methanolapillus africanus TaxID=3028297 RepID=A0AAE4MIV5_9EURY|nr:hypothetical protein [Methanosarcinaceae archaeon Ag5]
MIKRQIIPAILLLLVVLVLMGTAAAAIGGNGLTKATAYGIDDDTNYTEWNNTLRGNNQHILVTSTTRLGDVLQNAYPGSTIYLTDDAPYTASTCIIGNNSTTITINESTDAPIIELTSPFDITGKSNIRIDNVTVSGTDAARSGFRILSSDNITLDNVTVKNSTRTCFDFNRNKDCTYTNLNAIGNGADGFGMTFVQGINIFVTGTTSNNGWGGVNINNKEYYDGHDIGISNINVSGVVSLESVPVVLEEYNNSAPAVQSAVGSMFGNLTNNSIIISNSNGISSEPIFGKVVLLNPTNDAATNGAILKDEIAKNTEDENQISLPPKTFALGTDVTVPNNVTLSVSKNTVIDDGNITTTGGGEVNTVVRAESSSGGGGVGQATVVNTTQTNNTTTNATNNTTVNNTTTPATNTSNTSANTSVNTTANNTSTPSNESWWSKNMWYIIIAIVILIILAAGAYYYFYMRPKQ